MSQFNPANHSSRESHTQTIFGAVLGMSLVFASPSFAGREGNGGVGVVCKDPNGAILKAELLDIFEGRNLYGLAYPNDNLDLDTRLGVVQSRLFQNSAFFSDFKTEIARVKSNMVFLPNGVVLEPTNDAFPVINQKGCAFAQIANYKDEDDQLYVDREIFTKLDPINRAALYVHEAVYSIARKNISDTSSVRSRKLTAYLLAKKENGDVITKLMSQMNKKPIVIPEPILEEPRLAFLRIQTGLYKSDSPYACSFFIMKEEKSPNVIFRTFVQDRASSSEIYCRTDGFEQPLWCDDLDCSQWGSSFNRPRPTDSCKGLDTRSWIHIATVTPMDGGNLLVENLEVGPPEGAGKNTTCRWPNLAFTRVAQ